MDLDGILQGYLYLLVYNHIDFSEYCITFEVCMFDFAVVILVHNFRVILGDLKNGYPDLK